MIELYPNSREYISTISTGTIASILSEILERKLKDDELVYDFLDSVRERACQLASKTRFDIDDVKRSIADAYWDILNHPGASVDMSYNNG